MLQTILNLTVLLIFSVIFSITYLHHRNLTAAIEQFLKIEEEQHQRIIKLEAQVHQYYIPTKTVRKAEKK